MNSVKFFTAEEIKQLRKPVSLSINGPHGWSKSQVEPKKLLKAFQALHLKKGFVLRAYQFRGGGNGNAVVWAMPEDSPFPSPKDCPKLEDTLLESPRPPLALDDIMEVIEGDGSFWSYLSASIFLREIKEFGALWHGCSWSTHCIIDEQFKYREFSFNTIDEWSWSEEKSKEWRPSVKKTNDKVIVNFYTYTGLFPEGIVYNTDTFSIGSYCFISDYKLIAESGGGYIH